MNVRPLFSEAFYTVQESLVNFGIQEGVLSILPEQKKSLGQKVNEFFFGKLTDPKFLEMVQQVREIQTDSHKLQVIENEVHRRGWLSAMCLRQNVQNMSAAITVAKPGIVSLALCKIMNLFRLVFFSKPIEIPEFQQDVNPFLQATYAGLETRDDDFERCQYTVGLLKSSYYDGSQSFFQKSTNRIELGLDEGLNIRELDPSCFRMRTESSSGDVIADKILEKEFLWLGYNAERKVFTLGVENQPFNDRLPNECLRWFLSNRQGSLPSPIRQVITYRGILEGDKAVDVSFTRLITFQCEGTCGYKITYLDKKEIDLKTDIVYTISQKGSEPRLQLMFCKKVSCTEGV